MSISDRADFIATNTRLLPVPHAPEVRLHLADEATELWSKTEEELGEIGLPPPFWAFAWAGGQALARWVLDNPDVVRGKHVLDFAAGSGLVGIAASMAGAAQTTCVDIDAYAISAICLNARANGCEVSARQGDIVGTDEGWDVVLAGDVSYERDMAARVTEWLSGLARRGAIVRIGDPGRSYLARKRLVSIAEYRIAVSRSLEDTEIKRTGVWRFAGAP